MRFALFEEVYYANNKEYEDYYRQNVCAIEAHPILNLSALTGVSFFGKLLPAPAAFS